MKILMVNKFLYPNGGSEAYIFKLGNYLQLQGHEVQYFGMEHKGRIVGNHAEAYTSDMDFHGGPKLAKLTYPIKTIYSSEARRKIRKVLDDFQPDVVHLNNFNYQLTPSVILEAAKWRKQTGRKCRIIFTAHDYNLVCPNHLLYNPNTRQICEKCLGGHFINCARGRCIHSSLAKSIVGAIEGYFWNWNGAYKYIDAVVCPSRFNKSKMDKNPHLADRTIFLRNFTDKAPHKEVKKKRYVLYFGRFSQEKGIDTLLEAIKALPDVQFVFAGSGPMEDKINSLKNIENVGFKSGDQLDDLIREAQFCLCASEWVENCPLSVIESEERGTPVIGTRIGGIPELISDGINGGLFELKDSKGLAEIIRELWENPEIVRKYSQECLKLSRDALEEYYAKIMSVYEGK